MRNASATSGNVVVKWRNRLRLESYKMVEPSARLTAA